MTQQVSYLTADHLGSPRVVSNENGVITDRKDYSAFGEESASSQRSGHGEYSGADELRKGYTGYEKDGESGLEFAQARYYNASHGRYTSVDPLTASVSTRNPQTFNRYSYVLNSPYKFTDPLGLLPAKAGSGCNFECRVSNAINGTGTLSEADRALALVHIRAGTGLGYRFLNASYAEINRQTAMAPPRRVVALAARDSDTPSDEAAFLARAKKATDEVKQFSTGSDILSALREFSESGAIDDIVIHDHGVEGGIIGDGNNVGLYRVDQAAKITTYTFPGAETSFTLVEAIHQEKINISKNGTITIFGCNCSNLAQEISAKLGANGRGDISVTGANNYVYEKNGAAAVDRRTTGISAGSRGSFITYRDGVQVTTNITLRYE